MKPMLACTPTKEIPFPVYASPKIDGIRAIVKDGVLLSRSLKPIQNEFIQRSHDWSLLEGFDGELVVGPASHPNVMQHTSSGVMSRDGEPNWSFYVFDLWNRTESYFYRNTILQQWIASLSALTQIPTGRIHYLAQELVFDNAQLAAYEQAMLSYGFEGVMLRLPESVYKFGRSTEKEFALVKVKQFVDAEAIVIGYTELMRNNNELAMDNLGHAKRSSEMSGLIAGDMLGSLKVRTPDGIEFDIGTGFTTQQRQEFWSDRERLIGRLVKYKFFNGGIKVAPRFPVFLGFRSIEDLTPLDTGE